MSELLVAIGLVLVLEGLLYGSLPGFVKKKAAEVMATPDQVLRIGGVAAMAIGVVIVWLFR